MYIGFLLSEPKQVSCRRLGEVMGISHASVQGINLVTMYCTDTEGNHYPVDFRGVDKSEDKTKNDYFLEMLDAPLAWGLKPAMVTGDSGYRCAKNLKAIKNHGLGFMLAIKSNRTVSLEKARWQQVQALDIPANGLTGG